MMMMHHHHSHPSHTWTPKLRAALRDYLENAGVPVPDGLKLKMDRTNSVSMTATMQPGFVMQPHQVIEKPIVDEDASSDFLAKGLEFARMEHRRKRRAVEMIEDGVDPMKPTQDFQEGHPISVYAQTMQMQGLAGGSGEMHISEGNLIHRRFRLTIRRHEMIIDRCRITLPGELPQSARIAMQGRLFSELAELPRCGREDVDDAVAKLEIIMVVDGPGEGFTVVFAPARVMEIAASKEGMGDWKRLEPKPVL